MLKPSLLSGPLSNLRAACLGLASIGLVACGGSAPPPPTTPEPLTEMATEAPPSDVAEWAVLDILAAVPTDVLLDGKPIGKTPIEGHKVAPGAYDVTFVDEVGGNRTMSVRVEAGDSRIVKSDPSPTATVR